MLSKRIKEIEINRRDFLSVLGALGILGMAGSTLYGFRSPPDNTEDMAPLKQKIRTLKVGEERYMGPYFLSKKPRVYVELGNKVFELYNFEAKKKQDSREFIIDAYKRLPRQDIDEKTALMAFDLFDIINNNRSKLVDLVAREVRTFTLESAQIPTVEAGITYLVPWKSSYTLEQVLAKNKY